MLKLKLDMVPFGQDSLKRTLGTLEISNVGGTFELGNYVIKYVVNYTNGTFVEYQCKINRFPRKQGAWALSVKAIKKLLVIMDGGEL